MKISMSLGAIGFGVAAGLALVLVADRSFADPPRLAIDAATDLANAPGSQPRQLTSLGGRVVFTAYDDDRDERLWTSDGTLDGTYALGPACDPGVYGQPWRRVGVLPGLAFFAFYCSGQGTSLWRSDGSAAGTYELLDYSPAEALVSAVEFADGLVFLEDDFEVGGASDRLRLWKTDGTLSGTRRVVDVPVGGLATFGLPVAASDRIEVIVRPIGALPELWMSAGADFTTGKVATLDAGFSFDYYPKSAAFGRHVAWRAHSSQLWVSDGTASGAGPVTAFGDPSEALGFDRLVPDGDRLLFVATDSHGEEVWQSDGTPAGTTRLTDLEERYALQFFNGPRLLIPIGEHVVFYAADAEGVARLVAFDRADGSLEELAEPCGTLAESAGCRYTLWLERVGDLAVFPVPVGDVGALATSDGTPAGTGLAASLCSAGCSQPPYAPTAVGEEVFGLLARTPSELELWSIDAAGEVTRHGGGFSRAGFDPETGKLSVARAGDVVLLAAGDARHGVELFRSVVPGADLELVEDLAFDRADSAFEPAVAFGGELYLAINSRVLRTDGSREGTVELMAPYRGTCGRYDVGTTADLRPVGARLLIGNGDCEEGNLWSYEPVTGELSTLLGAARPDRPPFGRILAVVDGRADLLAGTDQPPAAEVWTSDGTEAETFALFSFAGVVDDLVRVGDLRVILSDQIYVWLPGDAQVRPVEENLYNWFRAFAVAGERAILEAGDLSNAATALIAVAADGAVETLVSFEELSWVRGRERLGDVVLFLVERGGTGALELWVTDGTAAGTRALRGFDSPTQSSDQVRRLVPLGDRLAFLGFSPTGALELWATDGTVAGTNFLDRLGDDETTTLVAWIASTGPRVFVSGYRASAEGTSDLDVLRLWSSPDAQGGATLVAEWTFPTGAIFYGFGPFLELFAFDGRVYFVGASTGSGAELWASDGSAAGTARVADIAPGPAGSWPGNFAAAGSRLYFSADDGLRGRELWSYDPSDSALCRGSSTALCLSAGRFRAEAFWTDFEGVQGDATAVPLTSDSGAFWFFYPANVELVAKVLDGTALYGHHWVFFGALSNVRYAVTVRDGAAGAARRYVNPAGTYASVGDSAAFGPLGASSTAGPLPTEEIAAAPHGSTWLTAGAASGACAASATRLCLRDGRFAVEASWRDFQGNVGVGSATPWPGGESGTFWFFDEANVELIVKVLDGTPINGRYWVYVGALSNVEYTLTLTDTLTGAVRSYFNPAGTFASVGDVDAF